jgi:hypothetical protein
MMVPMTPDEVAGARDIVGVAEIADALGVPRTTVSMWAHRRAASNFPMPLETLAMGPVYSLAAVRAWHEQRTAVRS